MPSTVKKILLWVVFGFLIYAVITSPDRAADIVRGVWDIIAEGFRNIFRFFNSLMNGG